MPKGTKEELAYIAGLVDGEGSIGIYEYKSKYKNYGLNLVINMCDIEAIALVKEIYGGHLMTIPPKGNNRLQYRLKLGRKETYVCLMEILPYLRVKKKQAEIALKFKETVRGYNKLGRGRKLPISVLKERKIMINSIKELKRVSAWN